MFFKSVLVLFVAVLNLHVAVGAPSIFSDADAMKYLASFGYLDPALGDTSTSFVAGETVRRANSDFQYFASLNPTGILDEETSIWMSKPLCGVPDKIHEGHSIRRQRNADIQEDRWNKKRLTYRISKYTSDLEKSDVDRVIAKAFQMWAEVTELTFALVETGNVDIDIRFESNMVARHSSITCDESHLHFFKWRKSILID